jgi:hypothetical protein
MADSNKPVAAIQQAWDSLYDIFTHKSSTGHQCVLLGDLNARIGSASDPGQRYGMYGERVQPTKAGKCLLEFLTTTDTFAINSRTDGDNMTFYTQDRPCSLPHRLRYVIAPADILHSGL